MNKEEARKLITTYGEAWVEQDVEKILSIFTPDATYFDPAEGEQRGHEGIRRYWETKVIDSQKEIVFDLQHLWVDGDAVVAEWHATFIDTKRHLAIDMMEVAIFGVCGGKFCSLREYYRTTKEAIG